MSLLQPLKPEPVTGVSLGNVTLLRLDRQGGPAPGNKTYKLAPYLQRAKQSRGTRLLSFGGAWSNHLHALAAVGAVHDIPTVGIVRGDNVNSAMLDDAAAQGMQLVRVSRSEYRQRHDPDYLAALRARFAPCEVIPEGGYSPEAAAACRDIAALITDAAPHADQVLLAVGTGTTLAGVVAGLRPTLTVTGISALKGACDLEDRVRDLLRQLTRKPTASWRILHDFHCGGFARCNEALRDFILEFERAQGVPLEPVYTGKVMYAVSELLRAGDIDASASLLVVHTGGLQGRRGFSWLS